jgi:hypothetical protein
MLILFKIWCTCLVLTIPFIMAQDLPRHAGSKTDAFIIIGTAAMAILDLVLLFALLIGAIWV